MAAPWPGTKQRTGTGGGAPPACAGGDQAQSSATRSAIAVSPAKRCTSTSPQVVRATRSMVCTRHTRPLPWLRGSERAVASSIPSLRWRAQGSWPTSTKASAAASRGGARSASGGGPRRHASAGRRSARARTMPCTSAGVRSVPGASKPSTVEGATRPLTWAQASSATGVSARFSGAREPSRSSRHAPSASRTSVSSGSERSSEMPGLITSILPGACSAALLRRRATTSRSAAARPPSRRRAPAKAARRPKLSRSRASIRTRSSSTRSIFQRGRASSRCRRPRSQPQRAASRAISARRQPLPGRESAMRDLK